MFKYMIDNAKIMLEREIVDCNPQLVLNEEVKNFYDATVDDFKIKGYPRKLIKEKNPKLDFEVAI